MLPAIRPRLRVPITIRTKFAGLTLVELMVTMTIVAIMAAFAAPNLELFIRTASVRAATTELASALNFARSEAIKRGRSVTVCKSADIQATTVACSTTASWNQGWLIFIDVDRDGVVDTGEAAIRVGSPGANSISISGNGNFANFVSYQPTGASNGNGTITLSIQNIQRQIVITTTGRLRIDSGNSL